MTRTSTRSSSGRADSVAWRAPAAGRVPHASHDLVHQGSLGRTTHPKMRRIAQFEVRRSGYPEVMSTTSLRRGTA